MKKKLEYKPEYKAILYTPIEKNEKGKFGCKTEYDVQLCVG
jgi:hypothetical protein